ncbi:BQ2448_2737 [Microbotryum intermedium]|uniref:BQ2448_2737 protein n=1 Tax=Microbotryum intermedium TaxID=269621 RepID=A0A238FEC4_9BASI|nr:BQ2448_2737 [Microbotryum intermedium]
MSLSPGNDPNAGPIAIQSIATANLGPVFVGWMLQLIFYGFGLSLLVRYVTGRQYKADSRRIKLWLWAVVFAATGQAVISFYSVFHYGTSQRRDVDTLYAQTLADCFATMPAGIVGVLVQSFLSLRVVSLFSNNLYRGLFVTAASLLIAGGVVGSWLFVAASFMLRNDVTPPPGISFSLASGYVHPRNNYFLMLVQELTEIWGNASLWLWGCCIIDVLITVTLSVLLYKRIVGFNSGTDSMLRSVIILSIETASYTATFALIAAILSNSFSDDSLLTNSTGAFFQPLSSFYLISFLVTLTSRQGLREKTNGYSNNDVESRGVYAARYPSNGVGMSKANPSTASASAGRVRPSTPQLVRMQTLGEPRSDEDEEMDLKHPNPEKEVRIEM